MKSLILRLSIFIGSIFLLPEIFATHIVGGYLSYRFISVTADSAEYELTLHLYKDCGPLANDINEDAIYAIFDQNLIEIAFDSLPRISIDTLDDNINNPCVVSVPDVCVAEEIYQGRIRLDRSQAHTVTYQRCCRNSTIDNIIAPGNQGSTYSVFIAAYDVVDTNSTPVFNIVPPIVLCSNFEANFDLSATDPDGDSLVYSLCSPFNYASQTQPRPSLPFNPVDRPPYFPLPFAFPQTASNPVPSNPQISIDSETGRLTGLPRFDNEQYVIGFCVEEYRNGTLLTTIRRGIQINTGNCNPLITTAVQDQEQFCDGLTVQFKNNSTANVNVDTYKWDFGVPGVQDDTSRDFEPSFTYPSPGIYTITLIANPDYPCNDTSTNQFEVAPELEPTIESTGLFCADSNGINFSVGGVIPNGTTFLWDFGSDANIQNSTQAQVNDVKFSNPGSKLITLVATQANCKDSIVSGVRIFENPTVDFLISDSLECSPAVINFQNLSRFSGTADFFWDFGDGNTSTLRDPSHTYNQDGLYDVSLKIRTTDTTACIDSLTLTKQNAIRLSLDASINNVDFDISPNEGCSPLTVKFSETTSSDGNAEFFWDFGDNSDISNDPNPSHVYTNPGTYSVGLLMITSDKCVDTITTTYADTINVIEGPIASFVVKDSILSIKNANFEFDGEGDPISERGEYFLDGRFIGRGYDLNYTITELGKYNVDYVLFNTNRCRDTLRQIIEVIDEFEFVIPNVFTPNGDGINEQFQIQACGVDWFEISIRNRFGERVFKSNSINISWDGRINGRKTSSGVFYYRIKAIDFLGQLHTYTGTIQLITN